MIEQIVDSHNLNYMSDIYVISNNADRLYMTATRSIGWDESVGQLDIYVSL